MQLLTHSTHALPSVSVLQLCACLGWMHDFVCVCVCCGVCLSVLLLLQVKDEWVNYESSFGKEAGAGITDRSKTTQLVDVFYSLVRFSGLVVVFESDVCTRGGGGREENLQQQRQRQDQQQR